MQRIGRYDIKSELGRGGMSVVYRAYDPRVKRDVALKTMAGDLLDDPKLRARFEREAQTIAALEHGAIVPVYDFGEDAGRLFLVMRMMTGGTLAGRLRQGPLTVAETARILQRIGAALDHAHDQGVIHRDIKPSNVLFDQYGDPFLADFGIAHLAASSTTLTGKGAIGTPAYMSPEQVYGDQPLDGRCDIYALGVVCFEMLTGRQPFEDETPARVMMKHVMDPVPSVRSATPDVSPEVEAAVARAMAKEPDGRFNTAGELIRVLQAVAREERAPPTPVPTEVESAEDRADPTPSSAAPTVAAPVAGPKGEREVSPAPSTPPRSGERTSPPWGVLAGGLLVLLLVAGVLGGGIWLAMGSGEEEEQERPTAPVDVAMVAGEPTVLATASRLPPPTPGPDARAGVEEQLETARGHMEAGAYGAALAALDRAAELSPDEAVIYFERAFVYRLLEDVDATVADYTRAIGLEPQEAVYYVERGAVYREMGQMEAAVADHRRAVELDPDEVAYRLELGITYREAGDVEAALAAFDEAVEMDPDRASAYADRAWTYYLQGDLEQAVAGYDAAIERDPQNAEYYLERGVAHRELGEAETALADFDRAISLEDGVAHFYTERANTYRDWLEEPELALADYSMAIELEPENAVRYLDRAVTLRRLGDAEAAMEDLGRCLELDAEYYWCYWERGWLHDELGETGAAAADFEAFLDTVYADDCLECQEEAANYIEEYQ